MSSYFKIPIFKSTGGPIPYVGLGGNAGPYLEAGLDGI
jgi:hypothetical protein